MCIQVRDHNAGGLQSANLRSGLGFNFIRSDAAADCSKREAAEILIKAAVVKLSIRESGRFFRTKHREPVHKHDMAPDAQSCGESCALARIIECSAIGHERRGSHDPMAMRFHNRTIYSLSEPKIIRIDDQTPHAPV